MFFNPLGAESEIFQENYVSAMAADDLVMQGARSAAVMALNL